MITLMIMSRHDDERDFLSLYIYLNIYTISSNVLNIYTTTLSISVCDGVIPSYQQYNHHNCY